MLATVFHTILANYHFINTRLLTPNYKIILQLKQEGALYKEVFPGKIKAHLSLTVDVCGSNLNAGRRTKGANEISIVYFHQHGGMRPVRVRLECSVAKLDGDAEGWEPGKRVGYFLPCVRIYTRTSTPRGPEASILVNLVDETSSLSKQNDQDADLSSDSEEKEPQVPNKKRRKQPEDGHSESPEETAVKVKKRGRKATWLEIQVTDMVNIIVNDENILRKLVFTNTKKAYNTEAYQSVLK
ncbi:hypothetical protein AWC38_SpisGene5623 [Stylophora pistillata]|uniref:Uncharacterized protein n=1 Tax=Stylophora pistillata TaxID=50429 RepID=A0A2B4SM33_STYPI|nr:hypothetical protein AWC38_SpisGene5623 [Stylophora pistillata]